MHDEDVKRFNYLKPAFLERVSLCVRVCVSVCEEEGHISKKHSDFLPAGTKSMHELDILCDHCDAEKVDLIVSYRLSNLILCTP